MDTLLLTLRNLGPMRLAIMGSVLFGMLGFFIFLATRFTTPSMELLYGNLEGPDQANIIIQLQTRNIPYELRTNGTQIFVPRAQIGQVRLQMANQGLPSSGSVIGYEIFDKQSSLGTTSFQQNVNLVRALEGELARTIQAFATVRAARVHLVLPKRELFQRQKTRASASVFLQMQGAMRLDSSQVMAVQHLVASAVPGLLPRSISIVDSKGELLARGFEGNPTNNPGMIAQQADERRRAYERQLTRTVEKLLEKSLGFGKVRAEISANMDFDRITTNEEIFNPDGQVVRSTQNIEQTTSSKDQDPQSVSVGNNLPDAGAASGGATRNASDARTEENVNFEISKKVINRVRDTGIINRLSVAVLVDGAYELDANGDRAYRVRTQQEMDNVATLVKGAIGFNQNRGDVVEVINMRFTDTELPPPPPLDLFFGFQKQDLLQIAEMLVILILAILVILLVVRPLISRAFETLPGAIGAMAEGGRMIADQAQLAAGALAAPPSPDGSIPEEDMFEELIDIDRVEGRVKASSVKKVGEIVEKHPDEALSIVRNWLYQEG